MKFGWIVLGFVFLTRCHVVVTTYCSKQQEEVLLSRAGESHICSHPRWLTCHCVLQAGLSACLLKPWHKEDCRNTCVCAVGCGSCKPHFCADCTKLFSLKRSEFMGSCWAVCPWQHRPGCVADTANSQSKGGSSHSCCGTHLRPSLLVSTACHSLCGCSGVPGRHCSQVQEVLHSSHKGSICRAHHVKSRTFPHTQGNILSCWQNNVSDLEVQMPSWKGRRFSWFNTVVTSHKHILAWVGRLHKEVASLFIF